jgi:hypothetical protein
MIEVYLAEHVIQQFKNGKIDIYYRILKMLGTCEIQNAHTSATFWNLMMGNRNISGI